MGKTAYDDLVLHVEALKKQVSDFEKKETESKVSEKRIAQNNEVMLRISMALPRYPELEDLLDYITGEIKRLLDTQGALVILLDEEKEEFFFPGAAYGNHETKRRVKEIRLPVDGMVSGKVLKTGQPLMVNDASKDSGLYRERDTEFGTTFNNYALVPLKSSDRIIGVLAAFNKTEGIFEPHDMDLLEMIAGTVALSIENARFSDELKKSYRELASLDRAKSKAINHLSHELKTPVSIFSGTLTILSKKLSLLPDETWKRSMDRAQRNVERIKWLQNEINDIIMEQEEETGRIYSDLLDQFADLLEDTIENESDENESGQTIPLIDLVRERFRQVFEIKNSEPEKINLDEFVISRLKNLKPRFKHRQVEISKNLDTKAAISMPAELLEKVIDGLVKNAVENTPDHGKIMISVSQKSSIVRLVVKDYGIGIINTHQKRVFEGFFSTTETADYSSRSPFDFNAGGRGADLLRMKIFSERYGFSIHVQSERCRFIPEKNDICPGNIDQCRFCNTREECYQSGGSEFIIDFRCPV